jgi:hypothetical protein
MKTIHKLLRSGTLGVSRQKKTLTYQAEKVEGKRITSK